MRKALTREIPKDFSILSILNWCRNFDPFVLLNSNNKEQFQSDAYGKYDLLIGAGKLDEIKNDASLFDSLEQFQRKYSDWMFGYLSYDVKNYVENLSSENQDGIKADEYTFFRPRFVIAICSGKITFHYCTEHDNEDSATVFLNKLTSSEEIKKVNFPVNINCRVNKEEYISTVNNFRKNILRGDIYEANYCIEFYSEDAELDPYSVYDDLNNISPMPFSAFMKIKNIFVMCASPERYLARRNDKIISQPIKGTAKRGSSEKEDDEIKIKLRNDPKEQSENVMIVDMVRNDLSRTAAVGSVEVEELYGIKTFRQLHQMVSTVVSKIKEGSTFSDVIRTSFPMGSMTGAPKVRAMQLIEEYECTKRGIFSGSIGYKEPDGDFDFNVVIRSIIYNKTNRYLSYMAGSAITAKADAENEYEECLLKARAMKNVLQNAI